MVILNNLTGRSGGLLVSNISVAETSKTSSENGLQINIEADCFYLFCYEDDINNYKGIYYKQTGTIVPNDAFVPLHTLLLTITNTTSRLAINTVGYNTYTEEFIARNVSGGAIPTVFNNWRVYKIPITINFPN